MSSSAVVSPNTNWCRHFLRFSCSRATPRSTRPVSRGRGRRRGRAGLGDGGVVLPAAQLGGVVAALAAGHRHVFDGVAQAVVLGGEDRRVVDLADGAVALDEVAARVGRRAVDGGGGGAAGQPVGVVGRLRDRVDHVLGGVGQRQLDGDDPGVVGAVGLQAGELHLGAGEGVGRGGGDDADELQSLGVVAVAQRPHLDLADLAGQQVLRVGGLGAAPQLLVALGGRWRTRRSRRTR
jgi:hypothetical protein